MVGLVRVAGSFASHSGFKNVLPGSFWEFNRIIGLLVDPPANQPAFHVVVPSLPGFGFSSAPPKREWTMKDNARILDHLMTGVLGYPKYMAQGGDWGGFITCFLGGPQYPNCKMINLNNVPARPPITAFFTLPLFLLPAWLRSWVFSKIYTEHERKDLARIGDFIKNGTGYFLQQATRPLTSGYAMNDSPLAILSWIGEKYQEYVDPNILPNLTNDVLTTLSIYFLTQTLATSGLPYRDSLSITSEKLVIVKPVGVSRFPCDVILPPMSWIKSACPSMFFCRQHDRGGHFPALEAPELLAEDLREMVQSQSSLLG